MIGDFLYQLTPRDTAVTGIELVHTRIVKQDGTPAQTAIYTVPLGRLFRMSGAWLEIAPDTGIGNYVDSTELWIRPPDESTNIPIMLPTVATSAVGLAKGIQGIYDFSAVATHLVGVGVNYGWSGELWLEPGAQVGAFGLFNANGANNRVVLVLWGLLVPKGNVVV